MFNSAFLQMLAAEVSEGSDRFAFCGDSHQHCHGGPGHRRRSRGPPLSVPKAACRRVFETANSAAFQYLRRARDGSFALQITRLGHQMVHGTAMSYAMQQMKNEATLRSIAQPLTELFFFFFFFFRYFRQSPRRTKLKVRRRRDLLTGLLHGIGNLHVRGARRHSSNSSLRPEDSSPDLLEGCQASISKAVVGKPGLCRGDVTRLSANRRTTSGVGSTKRR